MNLEDLKKMYDEKKIGQIEKEIEKCTVLSMEMRQKQILLLFYLQQTNRFRENYEYKDTDFETYLMDRWGMRIGTFHAQRKAFDNFPKISMKWGPELIASVIKDCGIVEAKKFEKEYFKKEKNLKNGFTRPMLAKLKEKFSKPKREGSPKIDWRSRYEKERKIRLSYETDIKRKDSQIEKLKTRVRDQEVEIKKLKARIVELKTTAA